MFSSCAFSEARKPSVATAVEMPVARDKTFRWATDPTPGGTTPEMRAWSKEIRRAIERKLGEKGYRKQNRAGSEIAFRMVFTNGAVAATGDFSKRSQPTRGEGGFTIEAREPGTADIIWRAVVVAPFSSEGSPRQSRAALESLVGAMFIALPPVI